MSITVAWHPNLDDIILCTVHDEWRLDDFNLAHLQIISLARRANNPVAMMIDLSDSPPTPLVGATSYLNRQVVSPFLTQVIIVYPRLNAPAVQHVRRLIKHLWHDVPLSYAHTHTEALQRMTAPMGNTF